MFGSVSWVVVPLGSSINHCGLSWGSSGWSLFAECSFEGESSCAVVGLWLKQEQFNSIYSSNFF